MSQITPNTERREYGLRGMTCSHCVLSVREEVSDVSGVSAVDVDLASGRMIVTGTNISDDAVRAAVDEAGYEIAR
jgi:copper chaperone